jgi:hypothetical protein
MKFSLKKALMVLADRNMTRTMLSLITLVSFISIAGSQGISSSQISGPISSIACAIYWGLHTVVFIVGLALAMLGAIIYAISHIAGGQLKGSLQGYGIGMITGGIAGIIIAELAPFILGAIVGQGNFASCT